MQMKLKNIILLAAVLFFQSCSFNDEKPKTAETKTTTVKSKPANVKPKATK